MLDSQLGLHDPVKMGSMIGVLHTRAREKLTPMTPEGEKLGQEKAAFLKGMQSSITHSNQLLGKLDPDGDMHFYRFGFAIDRKIEAYRKDHKDPHDLFDPEKPEYLGTPGRLKPFQKSLMQSITDTSRRLTDSAKPSPDVLSPEEMRKSGESYAEWKQRVVK